MDEFIHITDYIIPIFIFLSEDYKNSNPYFHILNDLLRLNKVSSSPIYHMVYQSQSIFDSLSITIIS